MKRHILRRYKLIRNPQRKTITPPVTNQFAPSTMYAFDQPGVKTSRLITGVKKKATQIVAKGYYRY